MGKIKSLLLRLLGIPVFEVHWLGDRGIIKVNRILSVEEMKRFSDAWLAAFKASALSDPELDKRIREAINRSMTQGCRRTDGVIV